MCLLIRYEFQLNLCTFCERVKISSVVVLEFCFIMREGWTKFALLGFFCLQSSSLLF